MKPIFRNVLLILSLSLAPALAQPLADLVPNDAIVYAAWSGTEGLPPAYADSHLKAIVESSKIREVFSTFIPQLIQLQQARQPDVARQLQLAQSLLTQLWKHPTAIYFSGLDFNIQQVSPRIALLCKAGAEANNLQVAISQLLAQIPPEMQLVATVQGDVLIVTMGDPNFARQVTQANSLKIAPAFAAAMKQAQADPVFVSYVDVEKLVSMFDRLIERSSGRENQEMVDKILYSSGLSGLHRIICTSGFDGKDWMSQMFVDAPAPRTGLLQALDGKAISPELMKSIPADATFATTWRFDAARLINRIRETAGKIDPKAQQIIDQGLGLAQMALARNLLTDVLGPLGDDWAAYCSPSVAGNGALGLVIVNHLNDPAAAKSSLPIAWFNLSNWTNAMLHRSNAEVEVSARTTNIGGVEINYIGTPAVAPAWAIKDDNLYLGLFPQSVGSATRWTGQSIATNPKFMALEKRLGVDHPSSFSFYDLSASATQGSMYQAMLIVGRYAGIADLFGVPLPEPMVPPLDVLAQHMSTAGSVGWVDDAGYHVKSISPFPGSLMFSEPNMVMASGPATAGLMTSILLPSLNRARETANRVKCAANMRSLGMAMLLYENDHRGRYPQQLGDLMEEQLALEIFVCPAGSNEVPPSMRTANQQVKARWVNEHADYIYLGGGKTSAEGPGTIILYEKAEDHARAGMNMLFADGHVEWNPLASATQMIKNQGAAK